jgi:hypothetical protein
MAEALRTQEIALERMQQSQQRAEPRLPTAADLPEKRRPSVVISPGEQAARLAGGMPPLIRISSADAAGASASADAAAVDEDWSPYGSPRMTRRFSTTAAGAAAAAAATKMATRRRQSNASVDSTASARRASTAGQARGTTRAKAPAQKARADSVSAAGGGKQRERQLHASASAGSAGMGSAAAGRAWH